MYMVNYWHGITESDYAAVLKMEQAELNNVANSHTELSNTVGSGQTHAAV